MVLVYLTMTKLLCLLFLFFYLPYCLMPNVNCRKIGSTYYISSMAPYIAMGVMILATAMALIVDKGAIDKWSKYVLVLGGFTWIAYYFFDCLFMNGIIWVKDRKLYIYRYPDLDRVVTFEELQEGTKVIKPFLAGGSVLCMWAKNQPIYISIYDSVGAIQFVYKLFEDLGWEPPKMSAIPRGYRIYSDRESMILYKYIRKLEKEKREESLYDE